MRASILAFCTGAGLLALGLSHFLHERQISLDSGTVDVHGVENVLGPSLPKVDMARFARFEEEPVLSYVERASDLLHTSTYACFPKDFSLSWAEGLLSKFLGEEQFQWPEGIFGRELVCGFCHQRAITLSMIVRENGVRDAWAYGMSGHVVVKFRDDMGKEYLVDPDYGVSPFPLLREPEKFAQLVRDKYSSFNNTNDVVRIVTSLDDNSDNYSYEWAKTVLNARKDLFQKANLLALGIVLAGAGMFGLSAALAIRGKHSSSKLSERTLIV